MDMEQLGTWADEEIKAIIAILPKEVREAAMSCALSIEKKPDEEDAELQGDELGLFEGTCLLDEPGPDAMPKISLFVENIWEWVGEDEQDFRDEVGTTFLHELGHYMGWDENEVADRGLE